MTNDNDETSPGVVYHNDDGTPFEGILDTATMTVIPHFHAPDGRIIENVVVSRLAVPPL